jgi:hypothetical protein
MATALSATTLLAALRAEGCKVVEYRSWRTHNRNHKGTWGPVNGVMIHHTVSSGEDSSVALCYNGHASLPGPLCHTVGGKSGQLYMVGHGRANHAGSGDGDVLRAVVNETALPADNDTSTDGNRHFYGLEIVNLGNGKDTYPNVQYDAAVRWAAALCRAHGWAAESVIGHKEWQPGKIDPHGPVEGRGNFDMTVFRRDVAERLKHSAGWSPGTSAPAPTKPIPSKPTPTTPTLPEGDVTLSDQISLGDWVKKQWPTDKGLQDGRITVNTALGSGYAHSRRAAEASDEILKQLEALRSEVAQLRAALTKGA